MILFKEAQSLAEHLRELRRRGHSIGFAPTMGALHDGHISLIQQSKALCDTTVSSIFVNPTQFNDPKDFEKYPVTISNDVLLLERANCDVLFLPSVLEIYPEGTNIRRVYDLGEIEFILEGKFRPGHFQGVCQVVHRLLDIVQPAKMFIGQKDYQQCLVIKRLVELLHQPVEIVTTETYREPGGLAMSSRNLRLNEQQKQAASELFKMLQYIKDNILTIPVLELEKYTTDMLLNSGFSKVDYMSIADASTLKHASPNTPADKLVALAAAFIGDVRLIDNLVLMA